MFKKLMLTTAAAALVAGSAIAQTPPPAKSPPAKSPPAQTMPKSDMAPKGSAQVITTQGANQMLASRFKGTDVVGSDNEKIGDVTDMLFSQDGKIEAYIVGVGGFLGIGQKDIALAPSSFEVVRDNNEMKLKLAMSKDQLKQHAEFKPADRDRTTTGQSPRDRAPATPPKR
ncbi:MAG: PRC-barrel domain-containing protein [Xanthobacteraceae bacterium]